MLSNPAALLLSVGGSPEPLVFSIRNARPRLLIFFVSPQTRATADAVLRDLPAESAAQSVEFVETRDAQSMPDCSAALLRSVGPILARHGLVWSDLRADYTGGTKAMSAAVLLSLASLGPSFVYVGGGPEPEARERGGTGPVRSGHEQLLHSIDPTLALSEHAVRRAAAHFDVGRYAAAAAEVASYRDSASMASRLRPVFEAFRDWDRQKYEEASRALFAALPLLEDTDAAWSYGSVAKFAEEVRGCREDLERAWGELALLLEFTKGRPAVPPEGSGGLALPRDLCAAAIRRARQQKDPEDGVLTLYSALEKWARGILIIRHGIDNSRVPLRTLREVAPELVPGEQTKRDVTELPLDKSFRLLRALGDPAADAYFGSLPEVRKLQQARNYGWREHGYSHVKADVFEKRLRGLLSLLGLEESSLPRFPRLGAW